MENYKRVIKKLKNVNLRTNKVELGVVDDLNEVLQSSDTIIKEIIDNQKLVSRNQKLLNDRQKELSKLVQNADKFRQEFFDLRDKLESSRQKSERADKELQSNLTTVKNVEKNINTLTKKISPQLKQAKRNISTFDKLITQAEKMAQELGVKIPTASFSRMRDRLRKYI